MENDGVEVGEVPVVEPVEHDRTIELIDKMDGFKRYTLVLPIELCFIMVVLIMVWQGMFQEALVAVSGVFGVMVGYYFGQQKIQTAQ